MAKHHSFDVSELCLRVQPISDRLDDTLKLAKAVSEWFAEQGIGPYHFPDSIRGVDSADLKWVRYWAEWVGKFEDALTKGAMDSAIWFLWRKSATATINRLTRGGSLPG